MAKIKSKKKNFSEKINEKQQSRPKSINPFEVHVNRQKFQVLGRKLKQDRGLPGLARAKSIKKRKETLLQEYKVKDKSNKFLDRRIGERNSAMTPEDRILARFTAERLKAHKRKAMFNLGEDEVLTHKGRSLAEIEKFEDPSSEEDDTIRGKLDANFVEEAHFGGGLFKRADESKGRAAIIDQLITESKKRKAEKQEAKEKTLEKTEQLDSEWRELMPVVANTGGGNSMIENVIEKKDAYDLIMNQLKFEARGTPTDRLKSESEIAAEEAKKLRELEEERIRRMKGEDPEVIRQEEKLKHRSADDLDDGLEYEEDIDFQLMYDKEGNLINQIEDNLSSTTSKSKSDEFNDKVSDDEQSEEEEIDIYEKNDDEDDLEENVNEEENNDDDDDDKSDSEGEGVFDLSDMREENKTVLSEEEIDDENENVIENKEFNVSVTKKPDKTDSKETKLKEENKITKKRVVFDSTVKTIEEFRPNIQKTKEQLQKEADERKLMMEKARAELPYTFKIPETYEEMFDLLENKSLTEQSIIVERMIKCHHPSLNEKNKVELNKLFAFILQLLNDADYSVCWQLLDHMAPFLFELAKFSPQEAAHNILEVIKEKYEQYLEKKHRYPSYESLVFLKLVTLLFPTSDKRHPVTTPSLVFIAAMLAQCQVTTRRAIATGLFLVTLFTQYVSLSKRILPEAVNFLCGILHLATPDTKSEANVVPPFHKEHKFLYLKETCKDLEETSLRMSSKDLAPKSIKIDETFKVRCIYLVLNLLEILIDTWKDLAGCWLIFYPVSLHLFNLEVDKYPSSVKDIVAGLETKLNEIKNKGFEQIIKEKVKPKALRLYDPLIQPVYENRKRKYNDKNSEKNKLITKYKQEMKGALREIRRDRTFLANVQFKEKRRSDATRLRKVKEIYSWGKQQQSELNKLERKKKRKT